MRPLQNVDFGLRQSLSIIIPTLNEAATLDQTLESLKDQSVEIIVVDGGSTDGTAEIARQYTPYVLISPTGRGHQQDTGARRSQGNVLLFLHADTQLPPGYRDLIHQALADPRIVFGAFSLRIHPPGLALDLIAFMANLRSRFLRLPYGDQALFVRRSAYFKAGGFRDWPVMEDVDLVRRLTRLGGFRLARGCVQTSARRWERERLIFTTLRNWALMICYYLGARPHSLSRLYPDAR